MVPGAAENDAVAAWEHVTAAQVTVVKFQVEVAGFQVVRALESSLHP